MLATIRCLIERGLLPPFEKEPAGRHAGILALDLELERQYPASQPGVDPGLPYRLRKLALEKPLSPFALGRVFLHLSQRRGFQSNRRKPNSKEDGVVKTAIGASIR